MNNTRGTSGRSGSRLKIWLLTVSVLANLAMVVALAMRPLGVSRAGVSTPVPTRPADPFWQPPRSPSQAKANLSRFAGIWARFESPDYAALIQNLRAAGCPEGAIRNIVIPRIDADFERRKEHEIPKPEFWRTASQFAALKRKIEPRLAALEDEKHRAIQSYWPGVGCRRWEWLRRWLFWSFAASDHPARSVFYRLASLSPEMDWDQACSVASAYLELIEQAQFLQEGESGFNLVPEDLDLPRKVRQLETPKPEGGFILAEDLDQMREALGRFQRVLPAGFLSEVAARLQKPRLDGVDLSEQELHELCRLRSLQASNHESLFYYPVPLLKMATQKEDGGDAELTDTLIRELLGPERFAAYLRDQDPAFQKMWALAQEEHLNVEATGQAFNELNATRQAAGALASDTALAPEQREAALSELAESTTEKLKSILGEKGYQNLSANGILKLLPQAHGPAKK